LGPDEFNRLINQASYARFNELYGKPEQYAGANFPIAKIAYARTQEISEKLSPFIVSDTVAVSSGIAAVPDDLVHAVALRSGTNTVKRVEFDRLASYLNSSIDNPTTDFPIYVQIENTYKIYPSTINSVNLDYLKLPGEAVWAYTMSGNRPVYDPTNSIDLEWSTDEINNIVMKVLSMFGISVKDQQLVNYAEAQKAQGN
jgi:hypothetical protein